jgi:sulfur carrier protein ThiS
VHGVPGTADRAGDTDVVKKRIDAVSKTAVNYTIVPASGDTINASVEVGANGISLRDFLKQIDKNDSGFNVTVNGVPAEGPNHHVPQGAKVKFTEKARGS